MRRPVAAAVALPFVFIASVCSAQVSLVKPKPAPSEAAAKPAPVAKPAPAPKPPTAPAPTPSAVVVPKALPAAETGSPAIRRTARPPSNRPPGCEDYGPVGPAAAKCTRFRRLSETRTVSKAAEIKNWPGDDAFLVERVAPGDKVHVSGIATIAGSPWLQVSKPNSYIAWIREEVAPKGGATPNRAIVVAPPPAPVLRATDIPRFQEAALCKIDPREAVSRLASPLVETRAGRTYVLPPGVLVNGWPAVGAIYYLSRMTDGSTVHMLATVVQAPSSQVLTWGRLLPNMTLPQTVTTGGVESSALGPILRAKSLNFIEPQTQIGALPILGWQTSDRLREIKYVTVDGGQVGVITCGQIAGVPTSILQSKLGGVAQITAAPDLSSDFLAGTWRIEKSLPNGCKQVYGDLGGTLDSAMIRGDWNEVARRTMAAGCKADITYFLLGRSAEAVSRPAAAINYYREAYRLTTNSGSFRFSERCALNRGGPSYPGIGGGCRGIDLQNEETAAIARLNSTPPSLGPTSLLAP